MGHAEVESPSNLTGWYIDMRLKLKSTYLLLVACSILLFTVNVAHAQEQAHQLRSPATARGFIGGESHDSYAIHVRKGQVLTVQISWVHKHDADLGDNNAEFFVGELPGFNGDGQVKFGHESNNGRQWSGKVTKTGVYYIYVTAHPAAHYTLKVSTK